MEGALIHLLCDLNDVISEYEEDYLLQPNTKEVLSSLESFDGHASELISNLVEKIREPLKTPKQFKEYAELLQYCYRHYVVDRICKLVSS